MTAMTPPAKHRPIRVLMPGYYLGEDVFSRLFHFSPDSINLNRLRDGVYMDANAGFERMTGWTPLGSSRPVPLCPTT